MCGRYVLSKPHNVVDRFGVAQSKMPLEPKFNIAPSQVMPVVLQESSGEVTLEGLKWGLVPFWSKEPKAEYSTINARAEGIDTKPAYRKPIRSQRCIIPATGFYEWEKTPHGKVPHFIHLKTDEIFGFAGLYDIYRNKEGQELKTFTIITTEANSLVEKLHNRMPVILHRENEAEWLDRETTDVHQILRLLKPYPADLMEVYPVSRRVNSPEVDEPELLQAAS